ncbi:oligosaccharide flippase family protein [Winogradskya humida]|uniref:O-antigen/teichoic acid export membrane protein n=1 Tax=Winogradskya humida TaxID=113566 RepID=A0ABQ3ZXT6_9ACTN|nr:oligosaccharide flippase family protein [Actinoplanes humidus]GIE23430.1 hypothetical protein Ahu01nite_065320 [Actinoplanes humidus]
MTAVVLAGLRRFRMPGIWRDMATTAASNIGSLAAAGVAGVVIARSLGPGTRGEYAAVTAWFGIMLTIGELGQTASITYHVSHEPARARDYLATTRTILAVSGAATLVVGLLAAPWLASGSAGLLSGYRLMVVACLVSLLGAGYVFSLQATSIARWNVIRFLQPLLYLAVILLLNAAGRLTLGTLLAGLAGTVLCQAVVAYEVCRRAGLTGGRIRLERARPLVRYGLGQLAGSLPAVIVARVDLVVLSLVTSTADLGNYAVAVSLTSLAVPLVSAIGSVAFPRLARLSADTDAARLQRGAMLGSLAIGAALMVPLAGLATWIVPLVFGSSYHNAVLLVVILAPGGAFLACNQVCTDLLLGLRRPLAVARIQVVAAALTVTLLFLLTPPYGARGAAVATTVSATVAMVLLMRALSGLGGVSPRHARTRN